MTDHVVELVRFRLTKNMSQDEFIRTLPASNRFLEDRDGFVARRLCLDEAGNWTEHVEWTSLEAATSAAKAFFEQKSLEPMLRAIDSETAKMSHNRVIISLDGRK